MAMKESGIEWVGLIPDAWSVIPNKYVMHKEKNLCEKWTGEDVMSLTMNGVIVRDLQNPTGKMPATFDGYQYIEDGDLLMCLFDIDVTPRCVGKVTHDGVTSPAYSNFKVHDNASRDYFYYYYLMVDNTKELLHLAKNLRHSFTEEQLGQLKVPMPPLSEQQAIADYLDETCSKIDEIIAEAKASIDEYKELRIAAVNDAVTHGIHNNVVKDSNVDWIGKIPDNWKIVITKRLFKIKKDIAGKEGYTVLSITQKGIVPKVFGGKGQFAADYSNYQLVNKGDFAMNHMDLLTGWLDISEYDGVTSPDYRVFVPTGYEDIYAPYYKYVMQNCYSCKIYYGLGHGVAGMGRWRLPADMFLNFKLPMPPKAEQKEIADFLDKRTAEIDSLISEKESLINDLEAYKKSLIYEVVTGKRRVV